MIQHSLRSQPSFPPENPKKVLFSHNDVPLPRFPSIKKKNYFLHVPCGEITGYVWGFTPKRVASSRNMAISDKICSWRLAGSFAMS